MDASFLRRSKWAATAAASSGSPFWNLTPGRSLKRELREVGVVRPRQGKARDGRQLPLRDVEQRLVDLAGDLQRVDGDRRVRIEAGRLLIATEDERAAAGSAAGRLGCCSGWSAADSAADGAAADGAAADAATADCAGAADGFAPWLAAGLGLVVAVPQAATSRLAITAKTTPVDRRTGSLLYL